MKHVDVETIVADAVPAPMTRRGKLLHWANLVRSYEGPLQLFSNLEHWNETMLARYRPNVSRPNAMTLAIADPVLNEQGLAPDSRIGTVLRFFEITRDEAHAFSCDCGGQISNHLMAQRIEALIK